QSEAHFRNCLATAITPLLVIPSCITDLQLFLFSFFFCNFQITLCFSKADLLIVPSTTTIHQLSLPVILLSLTLRRLRNHPRNWNPVPIVLFPVPSFLFRNHLFLFHF